MQPVTQNSLASSTDLKPPPGIAVAVSKIMGPLTMPAFPDMTSNYIKTVQIPAQQAAQAVAEAEAAALATQQPQTSYAAPTPVYGGSASGLLNAIRRCESGGNYTAQNPSSTASGAYQFLDSTWAGYGGYSRAMYAPPAVQDQYAEQEFAADGSRPWAASEACWG